MEVAIVFPSPLWHIFKWNGFSGKKNVGRYFFCPTMLDWLDGCGLLLVILDVSHLDVSTHFVSISGSKTWTGEKDMIISYILTNFISCNHYPYQMTFEQIYKNPIFLKYVACITFKVSKKRNTVVQLIFLTISWHKQQCCSASALSSAWWSSTRWFPQGGILIKMSKSELGIWFTVFLHFCFYC